MPTIAPFSTAHTFAAPRALVYQVHADAAHLSQWTAPEGFESIHNLQEFHVGGTYHYGLLGPNGMQMWGLVHYVEIVPGEKIVHVQAFSDVEGNLVRHPMAPTWPLQTLATTTFADAGDGRTTVTVTWLPYEAKANEIEVFDAARANMTQGFAGQFARLDAYLAQLQAR